MAEEKLVAKTIKKRNTVRMQAKFLQLFQISFKGILKQRTQMKVVDRLNRISYPCWKNISITDD